jgi:hypothetical protein
MHVPVGDAAQRTFMESRTGDRYYSRLIFVAPE